MHAGNVRRIREKRVNTRRSRVFYTFLESRFSNHRVNILIWSITSQVFDGFPPFRRIGSFNLINLSFKIRNFCVFYRTINDVSQPFKYGSSRLSAHRLSYPGNLSFELFLSFCHLQKYSNRYSQKLQVSDERQ